MTVSNAGESVVFCQLVESGGANMVLQVCNEDTGLVQEAAMWVLAALATNDRLRVAIAAAGGLRLMCNASCAGQADLQVTCHATWHDTTPCHPPN